MSTPIPPSEDELHAYLDDALPPGRRAQIDAYLARHPAMAERVDQWRRDAEALRGYMARAVEQVPNERLHIDRVKRRLTLRSRVRMAACGIALVVAGAGLAGGWQLKGFADAQPPMADAVEAYRVFAVDANRPVEITAADAGKLEHWLSKRLGRPISFPDLRGEGFDLLGGRLLSTSSGPAALIFYQDGKGQRVSLYIRQSERFPQGTQGMRSEGGLSTAYWYKQGYGFAVVSRSDDPRAAAIQAVLRSAS